MHEAWDRRLRLVHITIADEDGDGYPSFDVDRWVIEVRVPLTDDEAEAVPVARVTAFTVRAPDEVDEIVEALQTSDAAGSYSTVVTGRTRAAARSPASSPAPPRSSSATTC